MIDFVAAIAVAVIGSNALTAVVQHRLTRKSKTCLDQRLIRSTLAAVTYSMLSTEIECMIAKDFATPSERKSLGILYDAYKANGWNGDMEARMQKVYALPTTPPDEHIGGK
ncbi:MAG: hypothetical protein ACOX4U_00375 [Anaerovoracaceae bacterium]|jgi:hypothetical protein